MDVRRLIKLWPLHNMDIGQIDKEIKYTLLFTGHIPLWQLRHNKQGVLDHAMENLSREIDRVVKSVR